MDDTGQSHRDSYTTLSEPPFVDREYIASKLRSLYVDLLGGREVWPADAPREACYWYLLRGTLIEVTPRDSEEVRPLMVEVDAPLDLAMRAWDAGHTVRVHPQGERLRVSLIDPFGRRIDLLPTRAG